MNEKSERHIVAAFFATCGNNDGMVILVVCFAIYICGWRGVGRSSFPRAVCVWCGVCTFLKFSSQSRIKSKWKVKQFVLPRARGELTSVSGGSYLCFCAPFLCPLALCCLPACTRCRGARDKTRDGSDDRSRLMGGVICRYKAGTHQPDLHDHLPGTLIRNIECIIIERASIYSSMYV